MLLSMTGFGRVSQTFNDKTISVEIRALNSKLTDVRFKLPANYREKELDLRKILNDRAERGKIDVVITVKSLLGDDAYALNLPLFKKYYLELSQLTRELGMPQGDLVQAIMRIPSVVSGAEEGLDEAEWEALEKVLNSALDDFTAFRLQEGKALDADMRSRIETILNCLQKVTPFENERVLRLRQRLRQNLDEFLGKENVDENRFEQEVLFYLEKIDINEEKVRLEQHCNYFIKQLGDTSTMIKGRTLNFITQEIGREINTLGAKAYNADIQHLVVQMKEELEKIKEQVANLV